MPEISFLEAHGQAHGQDKVDLVSSIHFIFFP